VLLDVNELRTQNNNFVFLFNTIHLHLFIKQMILSTYNYWLTTEE